MTFSYKVVSDRPICILKEILNRLDTVFVVSTITIMFSNSFLIIIIVNTWQADSFFKLHNLYRPSSWFYKEEIPVTLSNTYSYKMGPIFWSEILSSSPTRNFVYLLDYGISVLDRY